MSQLYFFILPVINALNFSQTLILPLLVSCAASLWASSIGQLAKWPFLWIDYLLLLLIGEAFLSTIININEINNHNLNHILALATTLLFFYFFAERFANRLKDTQILRALWWGYVACTGFALLEFYLTNFKGINIGSMIPRPAVEDYEPTFLDLLLVRSRSTFEESGHFAAYISICTPFLVHYHWKVFPTQLGKVLFVCLTIGALGTAFSVSAFLFLFASVLIVSIIRTFRTTAMPRSAMIATMLILLLIFVLFWNKEIFYDLILRKFESGSFEDRNEKFLATVDLMSHASWLHLIFGFGPGSFDNLGIKPAISVYLNSLRDYGLLGLGLWLLIFGYAIINAIRLKSSMGQAILTGLILTTLYFLALPNYFHPHYYIPLIFYKRVFVRASHHLSTSSQKGNAS